jgi:hypothetical protein
VVPVVWIEQTTYRLQGGCSTTELNGHRYGPQRKKPRCTAIRADYAPTYLMRRNVGLPPVGFFGSGAGAGSAAGGLVLVGTASDSARDWMIGLAPSASNAMPLPVSFAYSA